MHLSCRSKWFFVVVFVLFLQLSCLFQGHFIDALPFGYTPRGTITKIWDFCKYQGTVALMLSSHLFDSYSDTGKGFLVC